MRRFAFALAPAGLLILPATAHTQTSQQDIEEHERKMHPGWSHDFDFYEDTHAAPATRRSDQTGGAYYYAEPRSQFDRDREFDSYYYYSDDYEADHTMGWRYEYDFYQEPDAIPVNVAQRAEIQRKRDLDYRVEDRDVATTRDRDRDTVNQTDRGRQDRFVRDNERDYIGPDDSDWHGPVRDQRQATIDERDDYVYGIDDQDMQDRQAVDERTPRQPFAEREGSRLGWHFAKNPETGEWNRVYGWHDDLYEEQASQAFEAQQQQRRRGEPGAEGFIYGVEDEPQRRNLQEQPQQQQQAPMDKPMDQAMDKEVTLSGTIESHEMVQLPGAEEGESLLKLTLDDGRTALIDLGRNVSISELNLSQGARVEVTGHEVKMDQPIIKADQFRIDDNEVNLQPQR